MQLSVWMATSVSVSDWSLGSLYMLLLNIGKQFFNSAFGLDAQSLFCHIWSSQAQVQWKLFLHAQRCLYNLK